MILYGLDQDVADWYAAKTGVNIPFHGAIGLLDNEYALRGAIILTKNNPQSGHVDIHSELESLAPFARGIHEWIFTHVFRATAVCSLKNKKMKRHLPRLGWEFEGRKRDWYGPGADGLEFRMTADKCRWIHGTVSRRAAVA